MRTNTLKQKLKAGKACFDSVPSVKPRDLEGLVVGSVMPARTAFQSHISSLAAEAHIEAGTKKVMTEKLERDEAKARTAREPALERPVPGGRPRAGGPGGLGP